MKTNPYLYPGVESVSDELLIREISQFEALLASSAFQFSPYLSAKRPYLQEALVQFKREAERRRRPEHARESSSPDLSEEDGERVRIAYGEPRLARPRQRALAAQAVQPG